MQGRRQHAGFVKPNRWRQSMHIAALAMTGLIFSGIEQYLLGQDASLYAGSIECLRLDTLDMKEWKLQSRRTSPRKALPGPEGELWQQFEAHPYAAVTLKNRSDEYFVLTPPQKYGFRQSLEIRLWFVLPTLRCEGYCLGLAALSNETATYTFQPFYYGRTVAIIPSHPEQDLWRLAPTSSDFVFLAGRWHAGRNTSLGPTHSEAPTAAEVSGMFSDDFAIRFRDVALQYGPIGPHSINSNPRLVYKFSTLDVGSFSEKNALDQQLRSCLMLK